MRAMIATAATIALAAATAAAMALHSPASKPPKSLPAVADAAPPGDAVPGLVWRSGTVTLRLTDRPCASDELAQALDGEGVSKPMTYEVTQGSRRYSGCWTKDVSGDVVTAEPGRDIGTIPVAWFQPAAGR